MTSSVRELFKAIHLELSDKFLLGNREFIDWLLISYLCRGHVLVEGPPGTGKTLSAKLLAQVLSRQSKRIQFTSDMLPSDILGSHLFNPVQQSFSFLQGPVFTDFLIADEINRTPPRTQSALLEAMEERQITIEGETHALSDDFFVIATQNPHDFEGTFPLPEVELDRFLLKLIVPHANPSVEKQLLRLIVSGMLPPTFSDIQPLNLDRRKLDNEILSVHLDDSILQYVADILKATRAHPHLDFGSSARGGIALVKAARVLALKNDRDFVIPDDIKNLAACALQHRIRLNAEAQLSGASEESVLADILKQIPCPT